ncbi:MmgE/PrpD family protein [Adlercreutzia sp. ZJ304]|uniref:MmgE/PrpD family protein n=1 Tax=Adlercreutzia sp. ZJ304 TaxID=2709791 RepID=UPI0013EB71D1|nr:MmgE/PrpD family protein [Adlercreutzia sp. ZJ304]
MDYCDNTFPLEVNLTGLLSKYAAELKYENIPEHILERAKYHLLDFIAVVHAGYRVNSGFNIALADIVLQDSKKGASSIFFKEGKYSVLDAAMINAAYAHGADMDDGNKQAAGHIGTHIVPAIMALAEERELSNGALIEAMIIGYDIYSRLGAACMPEMIERGFHSTGTVGAIAVAVACAKIIGLNQSQIYSAISLACTQSSGLLLVGETGQEAKPLNPARAAYSGMLSALLAERGVVASEHPLESARGWLQAMTSKPNINVILGGLGKRFGIAECYMKAYPSCRHTHGGIEAALFLRNKVDYKSLEHILVRTYGHAIELAGQIKKPQTTAEAKFSIYYAVATAFVTGHFDLSDLEINTIPEEVDKLIDVIEIVEDPSLERPSEGIRGAELIVKTIGGNEFKHAIPVPKGDPENPFTLDDLKLKLKNCCIKSSGVNIANKDVDEFVLRCFEMWSDTKAPFRFPCSLGWDG